MKLANIANYKDYAEFMNTINPIKDSQQRERALDPRTSFIVQAPAGSGKTELLTQRFLVLLGCVNRPEEILAITFTKKSAAEMRARIINALLAANTEPEPESTHAKKTWNLAKKALARDQALSWKLLSNPNQLHIQTIDSFNASLTKQLPILSHFGVSPEITTDATPLYREAVQELLSHLEENVAWSDAIAQLLLHMDNDLNNVQKLLINMLAKRDQWLPYITTYARHATFREQLESQLATIITGTLYDIEKYFPKSYEQELISLARFAGHQLNLSQRLSSITDCAELTELPKYTLSEKHYWLSLAELLLTKESEWRKPKGIDIKTGFPPASSATSAEEKAQFTEMKQCMMDLIESLSSHEDFRLALRDLRQAPAHHYQETQWQILNALHQILLVAVAQLKIVFQLHKKIDYIENSQAALLALGSEDTPTDLALALDYQIRHILIDEFQDTSHNQYRLLEKLLTGWETNDGRTLFIVGDPMQSIYRFREAEVGLFIHARKKGISQVKLEPLTLSVNFRSTATIVDWVNTCFKTVLPASDNIASGAISYAPAVANQDDKVLTSFVTLHPLENAEDTQQAETIVKLVQQAKLNNPTGSIAILVRARTHLEFIIPALKTAKIDYHAIDIDPLETRPIILDLIALTRALLHPADRIAWLTILRAPWCGLTLSDLLILSGDKPKLSILENLQTPEIILQLSSDGQKRLARILPVIQTKLAERRRYHLRAWVEATWILLGGPACLEQTADLEDATAFFKLLHELDQGSDLSDLDQLNERVRKLYASPSNQSDHSLQVMTIHNAKGLEFDTVILPHLERKSRHNEKQLLLWMEHYSEEEKSALIVAPVHATGEKNDSIYEYISRQHTAKSNHENGRLLYVAATRAKKQLHLLFSLPNAGEHVGSPLPAPAGGSLLEKLWPAIARHCEPNKTSQDTPRNDDTSKNPHKIKRLISNWTHPLHEMNVGETKYHQKNSGFQLINTTPKYIGIIVHQVLQLMGQLGLSWWKTKTTDQCYTYLKNHLTQLGVLSAHLTSAIETAQTAISNTLEDPKGQWILQAHQDAKTEFALTAQIDNKIKSLVIDRTFIDESGTRWIIDYKTALFQGENLEDFLSAEQKQYEQQMNQYAIAMRALNDRPIRLGLYFPLVPAWRELTP